MHLYLVELPVADWQLSLAWYRDHLGLLVERIDVPNQYALLAAGPARIALKQGDATPNRVLVLLHVSDLDAELARLAARGITPTRPITSSSEGYRLAHFNDPDGHRLALFEWLAPPMTSHEGDVRDSGPVP